VRQPCRGEVCGDTLRQSVEMEQQAAYMGHKALAYVGCGISNLSIAVEVTW